MSASTTTYVVEERLTSNGIAYFSVVNTRYDRDAASTPRREDAERWAAFLNEDNGPREVEIDWIPGSKRNWWTRNAGDEA